MCLALAAVQTVSLAYVSISLNRVVIRHEEVGRLRVFKKDQRTVEFAVSTGLGSPKVKVIGITPPPGVEASLGGIEAGRLRIVVKPLYAGRFKGMSIEVAVADRLELFSAVRTFEIAGMVIESLPRSLVIPVKVPHLSPLILAERPSGKRGEGQEVYSIEQSAEIDMKKIYWRGVARSPDEVIYAKVRESGVSSTVRVGIVSMGAPGEVRLGRTDLASEALAKIGKTLIELGVRLEVLIPRKTGVSVLRASSLSSLSECIVGFWGVKFDPEFEPSVIERADMLIADGTNLAFPDERARLRGKPTVGLMLYSGYPRTTGEILYYSGKEEVDRFVGEVLLR